MRSNPTLRNQRKFLKSGFLQRDVTIDFFLPSRLSGSADKILLLINDGQNMEELGLAKILEDLRGGERLVCVAIHAGIQRKLEYGVAGHPDFEGRGNRAGDYTSFVLKELLPYISKLYPEDQFACRAFAGFSLGALTALDIVWNHPMQFSGAGLFSGSFWWRSLDQTDEAYDDDQHRIMHQVIRRGGHRPGLKFFFQCGNMDEMLDRNNNGIIDSIDDTIDIIKELEAKGYNKEKDIHYLEMPDGRHDIPTWSRAMPVFLDWLVGHTPAGHDH